MSCFVLLNIHILLSLMQKKLCPVKFEGFVVRKENRANGAMTLRENGMSGQEVQKD